MLLGVLLLLMGSILILQGTGVYPVGGMAYQMKWTYIGIVIDLVAIGLIVLASRRRKNLPPSIIRPVSNRKFGRSSQFECRHSNCGSSIIFGSVHPVRDRKEGSGRRLAPAAPFGLPVTPDHFFK